MGREAVHRQGVNMDRYKELLVKLRREGKTLKAWAEGHGWRRQYVEKALCGEGRKGPLSDRIKTAAEKEINT